MAAFVTPQHEEDWKRLYEEGLSIRDIAKISGFGKTCIRTHLNKLGVAMRKTNVTPEMVDKWVVAFQQGESVLSIAEQSGVNDETVRTHLKKRGLKMRKRGSLTQVAPETECQWADLYLSGLSTSQIAKRFGVGTTTVSTHLRKMGIVMRKGYETNRKITDELIDEWIVLYKSGVGSPQIAKRYGVTSTTVLKYLHDCGIEITCAVDGSVSKEIAERYTQGESVYELADVYSLSDTSIRNHLKKHGVELRKENSGYYQISENEIKDWVRRYEAGEPLASIALSAGMKSTEPVRKRLVEHGVKIHSKIAPSTSSTFPEWAFVHYLARAFPNCSVENNASLSLDVGTVYPDVLVSGEEIRNCLSGHGIYKGLVVEYDGEYWHDNPEKRRLDEEKTIRMSDSGYYVVRVLENSNGKNDCSNPHRIFCTPNRDGNDSGLGFAITSVLVFLGKADRVDLIRDTEEISELYYAARNKAAQYDEWLHLYKMGVSSTEIAKRFETTPTTVTKHLKALGIDIRHVPHSQEERDKWRELYEAGMDVPDIASQECVDKGVVYRYLGSIGFTFDRTVLRPKDYDYEWKRQYEEGKSLSSIAAENGVSIGQVKSHLEKMGVTIKSRKRPTITKQHIDKWVKKYEEGATFGELSQASGVGATTIRSRLIERGVKPRKGIRDKMLKKDSG